MDFDLGAIEKRLSALDTEVRVAAAEGMTPVQWQWITTKALAEVLESLSECAAEIHRLGDRVEFLELRLAAIERDD